MKGREGRVPAPVVRTHTHTHAPIHTHTHTTQAFKQEHKDEGKAGGSSVRPWQGRWCVLA